MKHCLLLVAVLAALCGGAPVYAQQMYLDTDDAGTTCDPGEALDGSDTSVDVYLDTGGTTCDITSYSLIFAASGSGSIGYGAWADAVGFASTITDVTSGNDRVIAKTGATVLPVGAYMLGSQAIVVSGDPSLNLVPSTAIDSGLTTSFGSVDCTGIDFDNTLKLGLDWNTVCGITGGTATKLSTWGQIKKLYR